MRGSPSSMEENRWRDLPLPLLENIFERVHLKERITSVPFVCKPWYEASRSPLCWKSLNFQEIDDIGSPSRLMKLAEIGGASVEGLVYILFRNTHLDALLYFAEKCPNLKRLHLSHCFDNIYEGAEELLNHIFTKYWKDLEFVHFDLDLMYSLIFPVLGENCSKLGVLVITGELFDSEATDLVDFLGRRITRLELHDSELSRESLLLILRNCDGLQELSLTGIVGVYGIDEEIRAAASHLMTFDTAKIVFYFVMSD